jgi:preprotein translocase subunit SecE
VARDRKRARQRQQRRVPEMAPRDRPSLHPGVPGPLQHSGEVDEFDAALVRGTQPHDARNGEPDPLDEVAPVDGDAAEEPVANPFAEGEPVGRDEGDERDERTAVDRPRRRAPAKRSSGNRAIAFLRASWAELQRVQWPDRRQVAQATAVVLGFVVVAGLYLGVADWLAQKVVNFVL